MPVELKPVERTTWVDVCKGLCITLVVFGHISGGLEAAGVIKDGSFWLVLRDWVYLFHMPAFFFLSGLFAAKSAPLSTGKFLPDKVNTLVYPYVIWTIIIVASQCAMARFVNNPPDLHRALRLFIEPYGYGLWFLYALLLVSLAFYFLRRLKIPLVGIAAIAIALAVLAIYNWFDFWPILNTAMCYFVYYAIGALLGGKISAVLSKVNLWLLLCVGIGLLAAMTALFLFGPAKSGGFPLFCAFLGIVAVVCLAKNIEHTFACRFWALLGFFSLEIYLGHPLWGTLARVVLLKSGIHSASILIFGGVTIGIAGALAVGVLCRTWKFPYLFRWPAKAKTAR